MSVACEVIKIIRHRKTLVFVKICERLLKRVENTAGQTKGKP